MDDTDPHIGYDAEQARALLSRLLAQVDQKIDIFSYDLEPYLYNNEACVDLFTDFLLAHRYNRLRILVQIPQQVARQGHLLLELGKRLPSFVEMRCPIEKHCSKAPTFLIQDEQGVMVRKFADSHKIEVSFQDGLLARELQHRFQTYWEVAEPHPDLRLLNL